MKTYISARAEAELESAFEFINTDNPRAASRVRTAIKAAILSLRELPHRGRPSIIDGFRELVVARSPYIIVYRVDDDAVRVVLIRHASQNPPR